MISYILGIDCRECIIIQYSINVSTVVEINTLDPLITSDIVYDRPKTYRISYSGGSMNIRSML